MNQGVLSPAMARSLEANRDRNRVSKHDQHVLKLDRRIVSAAADVLRGHFTNRMVPDCEVHTSVPCRRLGIWSATRPDVKYGAKVFFRPISKKKDYGRTYLALLGNGRVFCSGVRLQWRERKFVVAMSPIEFTQSLDPEDQVQALQEILDFLLSRA